MIGSVGVMHAHPEIIVVPIILMLLFFGACGYGVVRSDNKGDK